MEDIFQWVIPRELITLTQEQVYESQDWHYGMRCSDTDKLQGTEVIEAGSARWREQDNFECSVELCIRSRLRKMSSLSEKKEKPMVFSNGTGNEGSIFKLLRNPYV